jgi:16S rRNA (guanine527-N7)-methyltransferase
MFMGDITQVENVSRETIDRLRSYETLVNKWQKSINLVSSRTEDFWGRHIEDCLQLLPHLPAERGKTVYDLGSGAGLPGLVLAIAAPQHQYILVESDKRKAVFLSEVCRELGLGWVMVKAQRIEAIEEAPRGDIVVSRALAPLATLLEYASKLSGDKTICLFLKGKNYAMELAEAKKQWSFAEECIPSKTEPGAQLIKITQRSRIRG